MDQISTDLALLTDALSDLHIPGRGSWLLQPLAQLTSSLLSFSALQSLSNPDNFAAPTELNYRRGQQ
ncbi:uncharacterized [Tachysurus ichikawai]